MMRLTEKLECGGYGIDTELDYAESIVEMIQRYGQLEDIEGDLGIDLITLFGALKNGIWIKKQGKDKPLLLFYEDVNLYKDYLYACPVDIYDERVSIHQYGKTWALSREELQNDE